MLPVHLPGKFRGLLRIYLFFSSSELNVTAQIKIIAWQCNITTKFITFLPVLLHTVVTNQIKYACIENICMLFLFIIYARLTKLAFLSNSYINNLLLFLRYWANLVLSSLANFSSLFILYGRNHPNHDSFNHYCSNLIHNYSLMWIFLSFSLI